MTVQKMHGFLSITNARKLRGAGAQYRQQNRTESILQNYLGRPRVGFRTKENIDYTGLRNQYVQYVNPNNNQIINRNDIKTGLKEGKKGAAWGAGIGLLFGGPIGAAVGAGIGFLVSGIKGLFSR